MHDERREETQALWEQLTGGQPETPRIDGAICGKIRGLLRVALARGTKNEYRQGCLAVLAIVDDVSPAGTGYQVIRETFDPGKPE